MRQIIAVRVNSLFTSPKEEEPTIGMLTLVCSGDEFRRRRMSDASL
jgi:hypothetical protein